MPRAAYPSRTRRARHVAGVAKVLGLVAGAIHAATLEQDHRAGRVPRSVVGASTARAEPAHRVGARDHRAPGQGPRRQIRGQRGIAMRTPPSDIREWRPARRISLTRFVPARTSRFEVTSWSTRVELDGHTRLPGDGHTPTSRRAADTRLGIARTIAMYSRISALGLPHSWSCHPPNQPQTPRETRWAHHRDAAAAMDESWEAICERLIAS